MAAHGGVAGRRRSPREQLDLDPEARRLRELARQGRVADRFALLGRVAPKRLPELFRSADCVLCPGWYEPFGMVALQAMACGTPVVAAGVGAHLDSLADPAIGRLVPPGNAAALAAAVAELLGSPALRRGRAVSARAHVLSHYTWPRVAEASARLYAELAPTAAPL
ncbi:glycosyltransferase [Streptacidiphilus monticola]